MVSNMPRGATRADKFANLANPGVTEESDRFLQPIGPDTETPNYQPPLCWLENLRVGVGDGGQLATRARIAQTRGLKGRDRSAQGGAKRRPGALGRAQRTERALKGRDKGCRVPRIGIDAWDPHPFGLSRPFRAFSNFCRQTRGCAALRPGLSCVGLSGRGSLEPEGPSLWTRPKCKNSRNGSSGPGLQSRGDWRPVRSRERCQYQWQNGEGFSRPCKPQRGTDRTSQA